MMKPLLRTIRLEFTALALLASAPLAGAQSVWNGPSGNWSTTGNWVSSAVPGSGSAVLFTNNVGAPSSTGTVDNTVDLNFGGTIASLQYANTNTSNGGGFYHTTKIASGQTLTVANGLFVGTLLDGTGTAATGTNCVVNATITGP